MLPLSFDKALSRAKWSGGATLVLLLGFLFGPHIVIRVLAFDGLLLAAFFLCYYSAAAGTLRLASKHRRWFQIAAAILVPLLYSIYFLKGVATLTFNDAVRPLLSFWLLGPMAIIVAFSWAAGRLPLDPAVPVRGFLIASGILFTILLFGYHGLHSDDYNEEIRSIVVDELAANRAAASGRYFAQYLGYVAVSYLAMLHGLGRRRRS